MAFGSIRLFWKGVDIAEKLNLRIDTDLFADKAEVELVDKENTQMFFDIVDRRYNKDCPNTIIFTSN